MKMTKPFRCSVDETLNGMKNGSANTRKRSDDSAEARAGGMSFHDSGEEIAGGRNPVSATFHAKAGKSNSPQLKTNCLIDQIFTARISLGLTNVRIHRRCAAGSRSVRWNDGLVILCHHSLIVHAIESFLGLNSNEAKTLIHGNRKQR